MTDYSESNSGFDSTASHCLSLSDWTYTLIAVFLCRRSGRPQAWILPTSDNRFALFLRLALSSFDLLISGVFFFWIPSRNISGCISSRPSRICNRAGGSHSTVSPF